jgi:pyridoxal phosphate enzyme (YggS family)
MNSISTRLEQVNQRINDAAKKSGRPSSGIMLLAVSKTRPAEDILEALACGHRHFGESYLQEALDKIGELRESGAVWHFIGRIQSNKTRPIAENFDWVHSIDKEKVARRLNDQRPDHLPPLNVCLQVMIDQEESKAGLTPQETRELVARFDEFPRLRLRGLMTIPAPAESEAMRLPFQRLRELRDRMATADRPLETLSMGMSDDLEAAIMEGATIVRIGTAIFGPRNYT